MNGLANTPLQAALGWITLVVVALAALLLVVWQVLGLG